MEIIHYLIIALLIVCVIILRKKIKKFRWEVESCKEDNDKLDEVNHKLHAQNIMDKETIEQLEVSIANLKNALSYKLKDGFKPHFFTCVLKGGQSIVILFEEELEYSHEFQQKLKNSNPNASSLKRCRDLKCIVFIDRVQQRPLIMDSIYAGEASVKLTDINCGHYKNRGVGSFVVDHLCTVLKGMGVESVDASLSTVDYRNKKKLYNFYVTKNGFELIRDLTEDEWGHVSKKLS
ncbi:hypothetical protein [Paenibacillus sp. 481]|uniref:hypothetical protein n=1 Tax=Paenibacillus sp. 481 TaxID=2835869 RepID=UPI001E4B8050|nr:hypothetical protein [Paenibacillus sp. 481]UHA72890.1 hypothetical protein KIK04_20050 [Paenibacillus sp. 481]